MNDSHNTFYQNVIYYKEKENAFIKELHVWHVFPCLCYKTRGTYDLDLYSRTTGDRQGPEGLTEFITM